MNDDTARELYEAHQQGLVRSVKPQPYRDPNREQAEAQARAWAEAFKKLGKKLGQRA